MRVDGQSVCLLPTKIRLHDIADAEGFVAATIERSGIRPAQPEHEELIAEGLAILYELAAKFEPQREGYDAPGRFSGFAAQFLPRKLGDAWHRLHPEHRYITDPETGKRRWVYFEAPASLDGLLAHGGTSGAAGPRSAVEATLRQLREWAPPEPVADAG